MTPVRVYLSGSLSAELGVQALTEESAKFWLFHPASVQSWESQLELPAAQRGQE